MAFGDVIGIARIQITPDMSLFAKARTAFAAAGAAAGAVIVAGINEAIGQANVTSTLQAQLGTTGKVAADQGKIAGKLYSSGVSDTFQGAADAIKATVQSGLAPPGTTNAQLQSIATKASDVANVFDQDLGGVTNAVSQLMRTGLAKNSTEAFDIVTKGFQSGADKAGDFLDTINEYGTQFRKSGVTGQQAIGLINQGLKAGARDADIVADSIKEFSIRAVDGSKQTAGGFKALGLNADDMAAKFSKGGKSANAVLDLTLDRLRNVKDPVKQAQIATQLFGTQAEDLGKALFALDPSTATQKLGKFAGATTQIGKTIRSGPSYEIQIFVRRIKQAFVDVIGNQVLPILAKFGTWVNTYMVPPLTVLATTFGSILVPTFTGLIKAVRAVVNWFKMMGVWLIPVTIAVVGFTAAIAANAIAVGITTAVFSAYAAVTRAWMLITRIATGVQIAFNAVLNANPVILVITAILALGAAIVIAYKRSETFRNIINAIWRGLQTGFMAVVHAAQFVFNWIKDHWVLLASILGGPIAAAVIQIVKHWDAIKDGASKALNAVIDFFRKLPGRILSALGALGSLLINAGKSLILGLLKGQLAIAATIHSWFVTHVRNPVVSFFSRAIGWLYSQGRNIISGLLRGQLAIAQTITAWFVSHVRNPVVNFFARAAGWLYSKGRSIISGMLSGAGSIASGIGSWIGKNVKDKLVNRFALAGTWLFSKGKTIISGMVSGFWERMKDVGKWATSIKDKIIGAIKSVFHLGSPSKLMAKYGGWIMQGLLNGMLKGKDVLKSVVKGLFHSATDVLKKVPELLGDLGGAIGLGNSTATGSAQRFAQLYMKSKYGWAGANWPSLKALWMGESGWRWNALNKSSGAYGIPQSLPASKMASAGSDWRTNASTQIKWGLAYIKSRYGNPINAYSAWQRRSPHWYDRGGLAIGAGFIPKLTNAPERILSPRQTAIFERFLKSAGASTASTAGGPGIVIDKLVLENHAIIGSQQEVFNWLVDAIDQLQRRKRI